MTDTNIIKRGKVELIPPSQIIQREKTRIEKEAVMNIVQRCGVSEDTASELLHNDSDWAELMKMLEKSVKLNMAMDTIPRILEAANNKMDSGSLEQAKHAITAWAIAFDKTYGETKSQTLNIGGKKVNINLGFKFTPWSTDK